MADARRRRNSFAATSDDILRYPPVLDSLTFITDAISIETGELRECVAQMTRVHPSIEILLPHILPSKRPIL